MYNVILVYIYIIVWKGSSWYGFTIRGWPSHMNGDLQLGRSTKRGATPLRSPGKNTFEYRSVASAMVICTSFIIVN